MNYYGNNTYYNTDISHFGILGMKWGHRNAKKYDENYKNTKKKLIKNYENESKKGNVDKAADKYRYALRKARLNRDKERVKYKQSNSKYGTEEVIVKDVLKGFGRGALINVASLPLRLVSEGLKAYGYEKTSNVLAGIGAVSNASAHLVNLVKTGKEVCDDYTYGKD